MISLSQKVAVVTGASSGVGRAIAIALANQGAALCLVGRKLKILSDIAAIVQKSAHQVEFFQADLTVDSDIRNFEGFLRARFAKVDLLIHSAGIFELGPFASAPVQALDEQYRCNVRAPFILTQVLLPMLKDAQGQIVFINSTAGLQARAQVSQYAASKHALKALSDSLRAEVNPDGVRVLNLFLGRTATPMQEAIFRAEGKPYSAEKLLQPEDVAEVLVAALRLPQTAEVTELHLRPAVKSY